MARIAFFSEKLPTESHLTTGRSNTDAITAFSYGLISSLADQQHEVRVFSTYRDGEVPPPQHPRVQILRPFRNWGWLEVPRLIPIMLDFQPEIIHIVQPRAESLRGLTNALTTLPAMSPLIGRPRFVMSLYDVSAAELNRNKTVLSFTDLVIVTNRQQADEVTRWFNGKKTPMIEIVPLPTGEVNEPSLEIEPMPALDDLENACDNVVLIPGDLSDQRSPEKLVELLNETLTAIPSLGIVFGGGWGNLSVIRRRALMGTFEDRGHGGRVLLTGPLSASQEAACLAASKVVFLASLDDSSLSLARWIRQSLQAARPLILRDEQCRLDPLNWQDRVNAFIVKSLDADHFGGWSSSLMESILNSELRRTISENLPDFTRAEAIDQPGNAMSRIYAQVLRTPRTSLR